MASGSHHDKKDNGVCDNRNGERTNVTSNNHNGKKQKRTAEVVTGIMIQQVCGFGMWDLG